MEVYPHVHATISSPFDGFLEVSVGALLIRCTRIVISPITNWDAECV